MLAPSFPSSLLRPVEGSLSRVYFLPHEFFKSRFARQETRKARAEFRTLEAQHTNMTPPLLSESGGGHAERFVRIGILDRTSTWSSWLLSLTVLLPVGGLFVAAANLSPHQSNVQPLSTLQPSIPPHLSLLFKLFCYFPLFLSTKFWASGDGWPPTVRQGGTLGGADTRLPVFMAATALTRL